MIGIKTPNIRAKRLFAVPNKEELSLGPSYRMARVYISGNECVYVCTVYVRHHFKDDQ